MFNRLSQLAQNVQSSFNADESEASPSKNSSDREKTIARLQADLEQAEEQNRSINKAFKKLLKEKEQEIRTLKEQVSKSDSSVGDASVQDGTNTDVESINQLARKNEEYRMLLGQKDETIQMLMADVREAEDLKEKVEKQERINTEKLMFELAERIRAHENIQRKLEETKHVITEKDNAIHNMADQMTAQDELLKAKDDSIKKLKRMAAGNETSEDMIATLQRAVQEKDNRLSQMAQLVDKLEVEKKLLDAKIDNRDGLETSKDQTIKTLWSEIEQKNEIIEKISLEKEDLVSAIHKKEEELRTKIDVISEKDNVVNDLAVKVRSLERELNMKHSDIEVSSEGASREIGHLKDQLAELNEILKSKTQTIDMFQKEIEEKDVAHGELRQKLAALHKVVEDKDEQLQELGQSSKRLTKERDDFKEKYENEAMEKSAIKEKLDKVGRELSQQLDEEAQKVSELMKKLNESENYKTHIKDEMDNLMKDLANCKEARAATATELDAEKNKVLELEKLVTDLTRESADKSEALERLKQNMEVAAEGLKTANEEIDLKNKELQAQRERFDKEFSLLQSTSESERGNVASLVQEMGQIKSELDVANQERGDLERETSRLKRDLDDREMQLEEMDVRVNKTLDDNAKLKEVMGALEARVEELNAVERLNDSLKTDIAKELENIEEGKQIRLDLVKQCDQLKKDVEDKSLEVDEKQRCLESLEEENSGLKEEAKKLGEQLEFLFEEKASLTIEKEEMERHDEGLNVKLSSVKNEYLELNEKVVQMEESLNHMVEKLNSAELKMNESVHEKEALEERLRQTLEERTVLECQKSDIEMALEEFVRSTESRKKRSGRSSTEGSEGARSTPNEGLSGYSTPVSKEGSPRNSAFLDTFQPTMLSQVTVGNLFEGKAISEIFRLVEEERKTLEAGLASATKEKEALSAQNSNLEDYLDLEKQKFKQASEEISLLQQSFKETEDHFNLHVQKLQEELSGIRYANDELELRAQQDSENLESKGQEIENLVSALRLTEDKLADKTLELTRVMENSEQISTELGGKEEQLEKTAKQNKQLKNKLKELMKERAGKEKSASEKDNRIAELEPLVGKLNESLKKVEMLETEVNERNGKIESLEQERNDKISELSMLETRLVELEEGAHKLREMSANEVYAANEKTTELERSFRELEDINRILKGDVDAKSHEIEDLGSILSVHKEEVVSMKQLHSQKDEELAMMRSDTEILEQKTNELVEELDQERNDLKGTKEELAALKSSLFENEEVIKSLQSEVAEGAGKMVELSKELNLQKHQNSKQIEYISKLEDDINEINSKLLITTEELAQSEEINKTEIYKVSMLEQEVAALRTHITEIEDKHAKILSESEEKLSRSQDSLDMREKEITELINEKMKVESKLKDLEAILLDKDEGLNDIVNSKNSEIEVVQGEKEALIVELNDAKKVLTDYSKKLAATENNLEEITLSYRQTEKDLTDKIAAKEEDILEKGKEIVDLSSNLNEKISLIEDLEQKLTDVHENLEKVTKVEEENSLKLEEKDRTLEDIREEKLNLTNDVEARDCEINDLRKELASKYEMIENLTEKLMIEKQLFEEQRSIIEQKEGDSGLEIERLLSKIAELSQENGDILRKADSLQLDLDVSSQALRESEGKIEHFAAEKENLKKLVDDFNSQLDEKNKECDEGKEVNRRALEEKERLVSEVMSYEEKIKQLEMDNAGEIMNLNDKVASKETEIAALGSELLNLKENEKNLSNVVERLETSVSEKDEEVNVLKEQVSVLDQLKRDLDESYREREELGTQHGKTAERCVSLEKEVIGLQQEMKRSDQEFEAERDIFAAKIADLSADIERLSQMEAERRLELQKIKKETESKDELIALKSNELEVSRSTIEKLESEEILKLQEELNEKTKSFEEYKGKVLKKMKLMKEELKKLNARNDELTGKEALLSKIELELGNQKGEQEHLESVLSGMKAESEVMKEERQSLMAQLDIHRLKIMEMENLNVSREENMRNFETEIVRYQRLLQDKDEEVAATREMMQTYMEETQVLQDRLSKKEEKLKILQEQLIANEEDFSASFTEKENEIEGMSEKLRELESAFNEKEKVCSGLMKNVKSFDEETAQLRKISNDISMELQVVKEEKENMTAENSELLKKVDMLVAEVNKITTEKATSDEEVLKIKEELAIKIDDASLRIEEMHQLRGEICKLTEEQMQSSSSQVSSSEDFVALKDEKEDLQRRLDSLAEDHKSLGIECKEKGAEIDLLMEQLQERSNEIERLKSKGDVNFQEAIQPYIEQISELQDAAEKKNRTFNEYKAKAAKKIKSLKEENTSLQSTVDGLSKSVEDQVKKANESYFGLEKENESLNSRVLEMQQVMNASMKDVKEFQSLAEANQTEAENMRSELGRIKQRLSDKEEEILTVKDMMKMTMNDMQALQEELVNKGEELERIKAKEDTLNNSIVGLNEELASLKEECSVKSRDYKAIEDNLHESNKQVGILTEKLDAKIVELDQLQKTSLMERSGNVSVDDGMKGREEQFMELERESEAVKLKLAKAIKRMSTMKKELLAKEELVKSLEEEVHNLKLSSQELQKEKGQLQDEGVEAEERIASQAEELQMKENSLKELSTKYRVEEVVVPSTLMSVAAEREDGWGGVTDSGELGSVSQEGVDVADGIGEGSLLLGSECNESVNVSQNEDVEMLKKDRDEVSISLKKSNEQLQKAKKKMAVLKKADIKRGKEIEELKIAFEDLSAKKEDEISKLMERISDLDRKLNEKEVEVSSLAQQSSSLKHDLEEAVKLRDKTQTTNEDLKKLVEVMAEEKHELDDEMKEMLSEIKDVMDIKNKLIADLADLKEELGRKDEECSQLRETLSKKEETLTANEWKLQELASLEEEFAESMQEKNRLNQELSSNMVKLNEIESVLKTRENEICSLNEEILRLNEHSSAKEELISELQAEVLEKENILQKLPDEEGMAELHRRIMRLEEDLGFKQEEMMKVHADNEELLRALSDEKATYQRLEEEASVKQNELMTQLESQQRVADDFKVKLSKLQEELTLSLEKIEEGKEFQSLNVELQQELDKQKMIADDLSKERTEKSKEIETLGLKFQEKEEEVKCLSEEIAARDKEMENLRESESSILQSTIDELRQNSSQKEEFLNEEIRLLKDRLDKENEIMGEESKIEHDNLVRSFEEKTQTVVELNASIEKLTETIERKDTVIAKLKLKLKQTIKDRDVIKGNLQSEVERISQEKDVVFNEFQAKVQQTENDMQKLKNEFAAMEKQKDEMKSHKDEMLRDLEDKVTILSRESDELRVKNTEASSRISSLEGDIAALRLELEDKEEVVEKYEWENSEKEDKIRDLEREARFFEDRKTEWEELKRTFEDTIEVKEKIMENLQKEIEESQARKITDSKLKEGELHEIASKNRDLESELKLKEIKIKDTEEELAFANQRMSQLVETNEKILDILGTPTEEFANERDICDIISNFKVNFERSLHLREEEIHKLTGDIESLRGNNRDLEEDFKRFKNDVEVEIDRISDNLDNELQSAERGSLKNIVDLFISEKDVYKRENKELSDAVISMKNLQAHADKKLKELQGRYEEDSARYEEEKMRHEEEKISLRGLNEAQDQEKISATGDSERQIQELEEKCSELKNEVSYLQEELGKKDEVIERNQHEKAVLEKKTSEIEHMLDLAKLETQQVAVDKQNIERQLQIMIQESESLKSSTLPEMQALVSTKNTAMLELRENFSEVISDKDSIIGALRAKIGELQQGLSEGNFKSQEELDTLRSLISQRDEHLSRLKLDLANAKRSRDWLQSELSKTITEKNNIGGSIQNQFESISKGLRGDIELFMEDKRAFETEFQLERLQLERTIAEQRREIDDIKKGISVKDKDIYELNFIVAELRRRVEDAADILSKEDYYRQLEERIEESHEKVRQAGAAVRDLQDNVREEKMKVEDLEMKIDISYREKGEVVLVYEGKIQKLKDDNAKVCQSLKSELREVNQKRLDLETSFESKMEEATRNHQFEEQRLKELSEMKQDELTRRIDELVNDVERLEREELETREEVISEVFTDADEKMLKLKDDYERIIYDKEYKYGECLERIKEMQARLESLTESNTNLSKNLYVLENEDANLRKELTALSNIYQQAVSNHKNEIENLLVKKGKEFMNLRSQFEEALEEKEKILENLREKLKDLREEVKLKLQENNLLNSEKEDLLQESIKKELLYEKLKINVDSLLSSVFEISRGRTEPQKHGQESAKLDESEGSQNKDEDKTTASAKLDGKVAKDSFAKDFEATISEAKIIVDNYIQSSKDVGRHEENIHEENLRAELKMLKEENSRLILADENNLIQQRTEIENLGNTIRNLEAENAMLQAKIVQFDSRETRDSNTVSEKSLKILDAGDDEKDRDEKGQQLLEEAIEEVIAPASYTELQTANEEQESKKEILTSLKEELVSLKAENEGLEKTKSEIELSVRKDFDDILQNLREDLQNALKENKSLMNENFMLKNVRKENAELAKKADVICQTDELKAIDPVKASNVQSHAAGVGSSLEAFAQTDVSFVFQASEDSNRDSGLSEAAHIQRYSSSDRLPEVVEDTLYSKLSLENLQTFSDSALDVESFAGHAKLELRLGEDTEDGDKSVTVADMQSEMEVLSSKLQQSKKMILKLKQMTKKYKTELSEVQTEKFEQVRAYEEAVNATKQELEESNLEKVRKEQDIRSLREEVRLLVKEKADFGDAVKSRIDAIIADHSTVIAELTEKKDQECAQKDETIRMLFSLKSENESKIEQLTNQLNSVLIESETLKKQIEKTQSKLDNEMAKAGENAKKFQELSARYQDMEANLMQTEAERVSLAEKLNVDKNDVMVDNARFDEEIMENYIEEAERANIELNEAFDLIRALEGNQQELENEFEARSEELNSVIESHEETIERMNVEKIEIEKSMQEMREVVKQVVEEKDNLVEYWRNENRRITDEGEKKFKENVEVSQRNIEECQAEIIKLREKVNLQFGEIENLQERLNAAEVSAKDLSERNDSYEEVLVNLRGELGHALEEKSLLEDKMAFFDHQFNGMKAEHGRELQAHQEEVEKLSAVAEALKMSVTEKDQVIVGLGIEKQGLDEEISKSKKKIKRLRRELENSRKSNQELADAIRLEMEKVLYEVQGEKASLYSDVISKDKQLQELRIHADHLVHEREQWNSRMRTSGSVETDVLVRNADVKEGLTDKERLGMQVNQLKAEKEEVVANLEGRIVQLKDAYDEMEKRKREGDLKTAELQARLDLLLKQEAAKENLKQKDKLESYGAEVKNLKGDIEMLRLEAAGLAGSSKMLFGQVEKEITSLFMNSTTQGQLPPAASPVGGTELRNLSPTDERVSDNIGELEEANEKIAMLEDSLRTWKERCSELEDQIEQLDMRGEVSGRRGSGEFLINIDDEGPSIETARPTFGEKARRLTKYSTSGISFKTRARSFFSSFMSKQRGMLPVRRILLMAYILAVHVLAVMSLYGLIHG